MAAACEVVFAGLVSMVRKSGGYRGETAAPNKRRQLQGVRGTGADGEAAFLRIS
jgi:hypothetical protein